MFKPSTLVWLAALLALGYFFEVHERIDWKALNSWQGRDSASYWFQGVSKYSKRRFSEISRQAQGKPKQPKISIDKIPGDTPQEKKNNESQYSALINNFCQRDTVKSDQRLDHGQYRAHLESRKLGVDSPIRRVTPFCKTKTGGDLYIPNWLDTHVLIVDAAARDVVITLKPPPEKTDTKKTQKT